MKPRLADLLRATPARSHDYLPLSEVESWRPLAARLGVSQIARSRDGFLHAYTDADGDPERLSDAWKRKRAAFIARHMAQVQKRKEPLWVRGKGGEKFPSRRHLALLMWAYSPKTTGRPPAGSRADLPPDLPPGTPVWLRFGEPPPSGRSAVGASYRANLTRMGLHGAANPRRQAGVSVYNVRWDAHRGRWVIPDTYSASFHATLDALFSETCAGRRRALLVTGRLLAETGSDGEPLLANVQVLRPVPLDQLYNAEVWEGGDGAADCLTPEMKTIATAVRRVQTARGALTKLRTLGYAPRLIEGQAWIGYHRQADPVAKLPGYSSSSPTIPHTWVAVTGHDGTELIVDPVGARHRFRFDETLVQRPNDDYIPTMSGSAARALALGRTVARPPPLEPVPYPYRGPRGWTWGWRVWIWPRTVNLSAEGEPLDPRLRAQGLPRALRAPLQAALTRRRPVLRALHALPGANPAEPFYVRFGNLETSGCFLQGPNPEERIAGDFERRGEMGMSVYAARPHPSIPGRWDLQAPNVREAIHTSTPADMAELITRFLRKGRPILLVQGTRVTIPDAHPETGEPGEIPVYGADGEPLLDPDETRVIARLRPWQIGRGKRPARRQ